MTPEARRLGILLLSGTHERAHFAFTLAAGAAAMGRVVVLFASNGGCQALTADVTELEGAAVTAEGVAGLTELREASVALGVRLLACEAGLRVAGINPGGLIAGVKIVGVVTFLEAVDAGQIVTV